jgi:hypothetical protein
MVRLFSALPVAGRLMTALDYMKPMKIMNCLLALLIVASVSFGAEADKSKTEDDIREAVFTYQIQKWGSYEQYSGKIFFLSFGSFRDPSDEFMKRFAGYGKRVKKESQAAGDITGVKDKETGQSGLVLNVTEIKWIGDAEVEVDGGYYEHGQSASINTYCLKRIEDKWIVTKTIQGPIS